MKLLSNEEEIDELWSPPVRGRGLKPYLKERSISRWLVAPRAGAWIET